VGDHGDLGGEALDVFGFLLQQAVRDEQREHDVLVAGGLDAFVHRGLDARPRWRTRTA